MQEAEAEDIGPPDSGSWRLEPETRWVRDERGRVGKLLGADRVVYASGEQRRPERFAEISDAAGAQYEFAKQRDEMWAVVYQLDSLNRQVLNRATRHREKIPRDSLRYEELLADVGVKCLRRLALLYDASRCGSSLRGYAAKCLKRAYARALTDGGSRREGSVRDVLDAETPHAPCEKLGGLEHGEQLLYIIERAGLGESDVALLLARYDSNESLRDLAEQLNVSSPQTVLNTINRILERCRRAAG